MTRASIWSPPAYVYLLPLLPVLRLFAGNTDAVTWQSAALSAAILFALYLVVRTLVVLLCFGHRLADPLLACLFSGLFLAVTFIGDRSFNWQWAALWLAIAAVIVRKAGIIPLFNRFLPIFVAAMGAQALFSIVTNPNLRERPTLQEFVSNSFADTPVLGTPPAEAPDIYYIVFDRYARQDMLKNIYGHDNEPFLAELEKRGFVVPRDAYANYQRTAASIVSTLNMDYLDKLQTPATESSSDWVPLYSLFQDFRAARALKSLGYGTHFFGTWWEPTRRISGVDENHNFYELPEALRVVYEYSLVVDIARLAGLRQLDPLWWQCQRSGKMFDGIAGLSQNPAPTFTFAHFLIPHPPFVTHETGRCMEIVEAQSRSRAQNYVGQLNYTNGRILELVDTILSRSGPRPIILLQSDEGPWPAQFAGEEIDRMGRDVTGVKWLTIDDNLLREKMAIFSAYYVPDNMKARFNNRTSPINTFRFLLKDVFGASIDPLPEKNMIFESSGQPYRYHDVTRRLYEP
jgi:hypothetical protein